MPTPSAAPARSRAACARASAPAAVSASLKGCAATPLGTSSGRGSTSSPRRSSAHLSASSLTAFVLPRAISTPSSLTVGHSGKTPAHRTGSERLAGPGCGVWEAGSGNTEFRVRRPANELPHRPAPKYNHLPYLAPHPLPPAFPISPVRAAQLPGSGSIRDSCPTGFKTTLLLRSPPQATSYEPQTSPRYLQPDARRTSVAASATHHVPRTTYYVPFTHSPSTSATSSARSSASARARTGAGATPR